MTHLQLQDLVTAPFQVTGIVSSLAHPLAVGPGGPCLSIHKSHFLTTPGWNIPSNFYCTALPSHEVVILLWILLRFLQSCHNVSRDGNFTCSSGRVFVLWFN